MGSSWPHRPPLPYTLTCCQGGDARLGSLDHSAGTQAVTAGRGAMGEERIWEKSYPAGVRWDAPLDITTLPDLLTTAAERFGSRPALEYRDRKITYGELAAEVDAVASGLIDLG